MTQTTGRRLALGLMVISSLALSFGGLIVRSIEAADPWQINFYRATALCGAILAILALQYRGETLARIRHIGLPGLLGGTLLAAAGIAFLESITRTTVANTLFTLSSIPFVTAGLAWFFLRERLEAVTLLTMAAAAAGILIMIAESLGSGQVYGSTMAVFSVLGFSSFAVLVRRYRQTDMLPTILVSGIVVGGVALLASGGALGVSLHDLLLCLLWGGVLSGLGNWLFIVAARSLLAAEISLFMLLEVALGPIWVWSIVGETVSWTTLLGGTLVIVSVAFRALIELRRAGQTPLRAEPPGPVA